MKIVYCTSPIIGMYEVVIKYMTGTEIRLPVKSLEAGIALCASIKENVKNYWGN